MATLNDSLDLLAGVRADNKENPDLTGLNDKQLADLLYEQTGDERLQPARQSSAIGRGVANVGRTFSNWGGNVERAIADEKSSFPMQVAGRAAGNLVSSAPELGINLASAALKGIPRYLGFGAGAAFSYGRTKAETGSDKAAFGSAAGSLASLAGGIGGASLGRKLAGPAAGKVGGFLAGTAGSAVGSVPGDALEIAMQPGGIAEFLGDPVNLPAYVAGQTVVAGGIDLATQAAESRMVRKEKVRNEIPELDSLINKNEVEELAALKARPIPEKTELDFARERQLNTSLGRREEAILAQKTKQPVEPTFETYPETPLTLQTQAYLVHKGKKAVMEIPKGTDPDLGLMGLSSFKEFTSPTNGNLYLYDESKATPAIIENSIKTNSLGLLLGYGTPTKPLVPTGTAAVLRSKRGTEKAAVVLGDGNEQAVLKSLGEMALGDDVVKIEPLDDVIKWRRENSGLQKLYSLASEVRDGGDEISFTNHVLDMFGRSLESKTSGFRTKGPRFQVDQNAEIGTKGLYQAVKDWAPAELMAHYEKAGIGTLLNFNKVGKIKAADFTKWVRENTPEVEVRKLVPKQAGQNDRYAAQHELESLGYQITETDGDPIIRHGDGREVQNITDEPERVQKLWGDAQGLRTKFTEESDAATGRYGVEPKPLEQMPGAVDILVRVPVKDQPAQTDWTKAGGRPKDLLYEGPHFGESDKNVLASIRGYEEILPSGEKAFHVFEVQSDWGQFQHKRQGEIDTLKQEETAQGASGSTVEANQKRRQELLDSQKHPLLSHYETLALKAAIQHARSVGAKYLAISDAETAMMTEGHDRHYNYVEKRFSSEKEAQTEASRVEGSVDKKGASWRVKIAADTINPDEFLNLRKQGYKIEREQAMGEAYDQRLPAIAQKLTRDRGDQAEFGTHGIVEPSPQIGTIDDSAYRGSPVFRDAKGVSKTQITARLYSLNNLSPEIKKLFSLYDADSQASFEHTLRLEQQKRETSGKSLTPREVLEKSLSGQNADVPAMLNFLDSIKWTPRAIREGTFLDPKALASTTFSTEEVKLSKNHLRTVEEAHGTLAHELTHGVIEDIRKTQPELYNNLIQLVGEIGTEGRLSILSDLKERLKLGDRFDPGYLSGRDFDKLGIDPKYRSQRELHEFVAGLSEASSHHFANSTATPDWYRYLPQPVVRILQFLTKKLKGLFGPEFPGLGHMLDQGIQHRLGMLVDHMEKSVSDLAAQNLRSLLNLQKSRVFDEMSFRNNLPAFRQDMASSLSNLRSSDEMYSWAGDMLKKAMGTGQSVYEKYFYSALFRTRDQPWTSGHFWNLHGFRPALQSERNGFFAGVGQEPGNTLTQQQSLQRFGKFFSELANPSSTEGQKWIKSASAIFKENQERRAAVPEGQMMDPEKLVSRQEMKEDYGMGDEAATFFENFAKLPELVAKEKLRKQELVDTHKVAKLFYRANKAQDIEGVVDKVSRLNRIASDFGESRFKLESFQRVLDAENRKATPDPEILGQFGADVQKLKADEAVFKALFDQAIRQEFTGSIKMRDGYDGFLSASAEIMTKMAAQRAQYRIMTSDVGYAPMTRRGRFILRVYKENLLGQEYAGVKELKGFKDKASLDKYVEDNKITDYETIDKEELRDRVRLYTPDKVRGLRDKAKQDLQEIITNVSRETETMDPDQRAFLLDFLNERVERRFQPLEEEYKDVVAVKGDKFKERRYLVPGFDENDFIPNVIEYTDFNTVAGNKQLTRAKGELLLEHRELDDKPEQRLRMEKELDYTLSNQAEMAKLRKAVFYSYLGFSFRHVLQNAVQIPLNGISQMVSDGHGFKSYKHFAQAAALAGKWNLKGSTGDVHIDSLLKQAEKDGISVQQSIESPVHETVELQNALDSINSNSEGTTAFGRRISYEKTRAIKGFERFMQSTSAAAESANRKTTFIASILAQRSKGVSDLRTQYGEASRFTNYVNFVGDKPNRPGYLIESGHTPFVHGPLLLASSLQSFTLNHISQLYSFWKKGWQQGSKTDKQAFATGIAHLLAFSGAMGFVGAATAEALFEEVTGVSLKTAVRKGMVATLNDDETADAISDLILTGLPGLAGVDLSGSVGLGSPLLRYQAGQPITAEQLAGPAAGLFGRVVEGLGDIRADPFNPQQWWAATRAAAPQFLSQFLRVADVLSSGTTLDKNQQPVGDPLGTVGSAATLAGFTPTEVSKQRSFNSEVYKANKRSSEDYETKVRNISKLLNEFNTTGNQDSLLRANEQFSAYLNSVGGLQDRLSMVNSITRQLEEFEGKVTQPPSLKTAKTRRSLETAFPSVKSQNPTDVSSLLKSLDVALSLGQDDLLLQKLQSLPSSLLDAILNDALGQAGLPAEARGLVKSPGTLGHLGPNPELQGLFVR